jgi:hypothetical protein
MLKSRLRSPTSPAYPLLPELPDYSEFDPPLVQQDLQSRIGAARRASARYLETRDHLSARLAKLSEDSAAVIRLLEARNSELSVSKENWIQSLAEMPTIDQLDAMLFNLRARVVARTGSEPSGSCVLDVAPFVAMGVLREGETLAALPAKVDALLARRERTPRASGRSLAPLSREAVLLKSLHKFENAETNQEIEMFRSELIEKQKGLTGQ